MLGFPADLEKIIDISIKRGSRSSQIIVSQWAQNIKKNI